MIELYQLLCVVTVVETVCNGGGLWGGVVVHDLDVGCPAIVNDTNPPEAMLVLHHPRRMISPFKVTSQLVALKNTLQPALHRTAMDRRLLVRPGRLWAI